MRCGAIRTVIAGPPTLRGTRKNESPLDISSRRQNLQVGETDRPMDAPAALSLLFHRLNNQLGIVLANAELLEAKATDDTQRARAAQIVAGAVDAMATAREIRNAHPILKP